MPWSIPREAYVRPITWRRSLRGRLAYVGDQNLAAHILVRAVNNYPKSKVEMRRFAMLFGNGLLGIEGDVWKRHRRLLARSFTPKAIDVYAERLPEAVRPFVELWRTQEDGTEVDISLSMTLISLNLITRILVGDGSPSLIGKILAAAPTLPNLREHTWWDHLPVPASIRITARDRAAAAVRVKIDDIFRPVKDELDRHIRARAKTIVPTLDVLGNILDASGGTGDPLPASDIRDELLTLLFAGHDTTAVTLGWIWYLLAAHPEWANRVCAEADRVVIDGDVPADQLSAMPCIRAVALETLRLLPPGPCLSHRVARADDVWRGTAIPAGTQMIISPWVLGRHRAVWERPDIFDPSRFIGSQGVEERGWSFGGGRRICIGERLAMREIQVLVALIAREFRFELAKPDVPELHYNVVLRPAHSIKLRIYRR